MRRSSTTLLLSSTLLLAAACAGGTERAPERAVSAALPSAAVEPIPVVRVAAPALRSETGAASYYADVFEGKRTASGERFRQGGLVAAHRRYPFGTILRVTNLDNDRAVNVRVVDRGPFAAPWKSHRRILDLSRTAARRLGYLDVGFARVRVEVLRYGKGLGAAA